MKIKTVVNNEGEQQRTRIEIPIEGNGGALGMHAVQGLVNLIGALKDQKTPKDVQEHWYIITGFASCCEYCNFLTEKSMDDLMHVAEELAENEYKRAMAAQEEYKRAIAAQEGKQE